MVLPGKEDDIGRNPNPDATLMSHFVHFLFLVENARSVKGCISKAPFRRQIRSIVPALLSTRLWALNQGGSNPKNRGTLFGNRPKNQLLDPALKNTLKRFQYPHAKACERRRIGLCVTLS
jgi:hypothetical protein